MLALLSVRRRRRRLVETIDAWASDDSLHEGNEEFKNDIKW